MSKIDDFNASKAKLERIGQFATSAQDSGNVDKFGAKIVLSDTYLGFYGNSSCGSWGNEVISEMERQIKIELRGLAKECALS